MVINIDLTQISEMAYLSTGEFWWRLIFWYFGWLPVAITFVWGALQLWLYYRQGKWAEKQKIVFLALDIPYNNQQSPRAVENLFTYLHGAQKNINLIEKWWEGMFALPFSFEIVSLDGYTQFIIGTPETFKDLVETAIYAQYPDAEISQVEDYTTGAPNRFPDKDYDLWGGEFILTAPDAYPIRLYQEFEHIFGEPETTYRDPMASLMDLMSSLKKGEQLWYQIILRPAGFDWPDRFKNEIGKIMGEIKAPVSLFSLLLGHASDIISAPFISSETPLKKEEKPPLKMMDLKPEQKKRVEGIQNKINKIGFDVKIRAIYLAKKEVMNKPKAASGFVGYMKQFSTNDLNGFKPDTKKTATSTAYFLADERLNARKRRIMRAYKARSAWLGRDPFILNTEELATIWHFPIDAVVKAPLVQRAAARRVEPPMSLPVGEAKPSVSYEAIFETEEDGSAPVSAPTRSASQSFAEFLDDRAEPTKTGDQPPPNLPFE